MLLNICTSASFFLVINGLKLTSNCNLCPIVIFQNGQLFKVANRCWCSLESHVEVGLLDNLGEAKF